MAVRSDDANIDMEEIGTRLDAAAADAMRVQATQLVDANRGGESRTSVPVSFLHLDLHLDGNVIARGRIG